MGRAATGRGKDDRINMGRERNKEEEEEGG